MEEITVLAQIEQSKELLAIPTAFEPGIWRYCFYATGGILPFMKDTFNRVPVKVNNIVIDHMEYSLLDTLEELRTLSSSEGGWVDAGNIIFIRFPEYYPPSVYFSHRYGVLFGFTNNRPVLLDGLMHRPGLLSAPAVTQGVDALNYERMGFNSASIAIKNTDGQFDNVENPNLFGNDFNLLAGVIEEEEEQPINHVKLIEEAGKENVVSIQKETNEYIVLSNDKIKNKPSFTELAQYYISNISVGLETATFHLKDKRERLSTKIPNRQFTETEYPDEYQFFDDNIKDKDMQEVYGYCFGVPGVCLQGKQIYNSGSNNLLTHYRFRFSSAITRVDRIRVKMTTGEISQNGVMKKIDGWTTVYQRVKPNDGLSDDWSGTWTSAGRWKPGIIAGDITTYLNKGEITLSWEVAKQGGERENGINEVRMDGVFINKTTPLEIIEDIMKNYSGIPYDKRRYNIDEIRSELSPLNHKIGIMFDSPISVFEAIEKLQSGCVLGFQFYVHKNRFTVGLDNPNRAERTAINSFEILNLNEVEIDWNAELYGSYTNVEYAYDYGEKTGKHFIDKSLRHDLLDIHRVDKEWYSKTLLANKIDAELKSNILLEDFKKLRPLIKNIKLERKKSFDLRIFDIFYIDFSVHGEERKKYPHNLIKLIEQVGEERVVSVQSETDEYVALINEKKENPDRRDFVSAKSVRCQLLCVDLDTKTGITTIEVRVIEESKIWPK